MGSLGSFDSRNYGRTLDNRQINTALNFGSFANFKNGDDKRLSFNTSYKPDQNKANRFEDKTPKTLFKTIGIGQASWCGGQRTVTPNIILAQSFKNDCSFKPLQK